MALTKITGSQGTLSGITSSDNILFNAASKGIYLGVTTATASNLLDDYEEGTFTATLTAVTPPTSPPTVTGYYTKIGNVVYINISFRNVSTVGASGDIKITGLPFTSTANNRTSNAVWEINATSATTDPILTNITINSSEITFIQTQNGSLVDISASTGTYLQLATFYFTDA